MDLRTSCETGEFQNFRRTVRARCRRPAAAKPGSKSKRLRFAQVRCPGCNLNGFPGHGTKAAREIAVEPCKSVRLLRMGLVTQAFAENPRALDEQVGVVGIDRGAQQAQGLIPLLLIHSVQSGHDEQAIIKCTCLALLLPPRQDGARCGFGDIAQQAARLSHKVGTVRFGAPESLAQFA
jgi:hypothetical protein